MSHSAFVMSNSSPTNEREKKPRGLSRLLGKREKTPEPRPEVHPDSAYGSSEAPSADSAQGRTSPPTEMISAEKNSEIANIDQDRNLALKPSTGEVFDEDTGEVVTVVTTTTTTTTTMTTKGGKKQQDVQQDVKREVQGGPGAGHPGLSEMPAGSTTPEPLAQPAITSTSTAQQSGRPRPVSGGMHQADSPPIPTKSAMRKSGDFHRGAPDGYNPVSPVESPYQLGSFQGHTGNTPPASPGRTNFSYPSRSSIKTADEPMRHNPSAINDLRLAAKGIHVGSHLPLKP